MDRKAKEKRCDSQEIFLGASQHAREAFSMTYDSAAYGLNRVGGSDKWAHDMYDGPLAGRREADRFRAAMQPRQTARGQMMSGMAEAGPPGSMRGWPEGGQEASLPPAITVRGFPARRMNGRIPVRRAIDKTAERRIGGVRPMRMAMSRNKPSLVPRSEGGIGLSEESGYSLSGLMGRQRSGQGKGSKGGKGAGKSMASARMQRVQYAMPRTAKAALRAGAVRGRGTTKFRGF
mmetsp:Transcript_59346/g.109729  ORF Transcript_59346/g.109729 Transcript_59346/m.109729 type:complete len:233 (+) Transcript_59346:55-753(+)